MSIRINGKKYRNGTIVRANPVEEATGTLEKIGIGSDVYDIAGGGGGNIDGSTTLEWARLETVATSLTTSYIYYTPSSNGILFVEGYGSGGDAQVNINTESTPMDLVIMCRNDSWTTNTIPLNKGQQIGLKKGSINFGGLQVYFVPYKYSGEFTPVIYSTEEREIGVWTDNKPLYEKTIYIGAMTRNSSWHPTAHGISNIEKVVEVCGQTKQSTDGRVYSIPHYRPSNQEGISVGADTTNVYYMNTWLEYASDTYVTVRYTKTTDVAGSGSYNTLGVPTVHYTTDEQVIGTWIDGKPLYRRTFYYDNQSGLSSGDNKIIQLDSAINVTKLDGFLVAPDNNKRWILPYSKGSSTTAVIITDDHYINLYVNNDSWASTRKVYITIEYTKTTD